MEKIIARCKEQIRWAVECIVEMETTTIYTEEDRVWLPCWLKAHLEILALTDQEA